MASVYLYCFWILRALLPTLHTLIRYVPAVSFYSQLCPSSQQNLALTEYLIYNPPLEQVNEYKHLGIMLLNKSLFKETPKVLAKQANKALFSLMKSYQYHKPSLMCYLFDMLIKPVIDYGSDM